MTARAKSVGTIVGSYRVTEFIAEGGCGQTFKGEHLINGEPVCIKDCGNVPRKYDDILIDESKAMWKLRHPGIPGIHDLVRKEDGSMALVMSYVPGPTLAQLVEKHGRIDPEGVAWITERVVNTLAYMHAHGVVHGDVKPQNIIVQEDTHAVTLVDFGLALVKPNAKSRSIGHTPLFASPEQQDDTGPLLPESDFYSLGMTMIFALGGGYDAVETLEIPKSVPSPLRSFIERLIVRDVLERPNWQKEDLFETFKAVRLASFGRARTGMKALKSA